MNSHGAIPRFRLLFFCRPASHQFAVLTKYICTRELVNSGAAARWSKQTSDQMFCVWICHESCLCTYWSTFLGTCAHTTFVQTWDLGICISFLPVLHVDGSHQWSPNAITYYLLQQQQLLFPLFLLVLPPLLPAAYLSLTTSSSDYFLVPTDYLLPSTTCYIILTSHYFLLFTPCYFWLLTTDYLLLTSY